MQVKRVKYLPFVVKNLPFVYEICRFIIFYRVCGFKIIYHLFIKTYHSFIKNDKKSEKNLKKDLFTGRF